VYSCDYNGWADVPEEEREGIDAFEAKQTSLATPPSTPLRELVIAEFHAPGALLAPSLFRRKAA
jgi:hypothetical protein